MLFRKNILDQFLIFVQENRSQIIVKTLGAIAIFIVISIINSRLVNKVKNRVRNNSLASDQYTEKLAGLVGSIIHVSIMVIAVLIIFAFLGLEVSLVLGGLSIAIGFAMETTIKNMISGLLMLTNEKVKIGDFVEILGKFKMKGVIDEITLRHTVIKTIDKRKVIIPNGELGDTPIKTVKIENMTRGELDVHVPRHTEISQVKSILVSTINNNKFVLNKNYTSSIVTGFDQNGFSLKSFFYFNPQAGKSAFVLASDIRIELQKSFKKYGIKAPYIQYNLDVE